MKIETMNDLYIDELRDLYSAETQIIDALPKISNAATSPTLKHAINAHLEETKGQLERLEKIFSSLEVKPTGTKCFATEGLLKEGASMIEDTEKGDVRDAAIIGAAQRIEHYEMSAYGTARSFAELLGMSDHAKLLQETLNEEMGADTKLNEIAKTEVNLKACNLTTQMQKV